MTKIASINRDAAKFLPASQYEQPADIVAEPLLTRGEKIATLQRWRQQIAEELTAGDEGMPTRHTSGRNHDLIGEIQTALDELEKAAPPPSV